MKKTFKFMMVAAAAIAMVGCAQNDKTGTDDFVAGKPTTASFTITIPKGPSTRGTEGTPVAGTADETNLNTSLKAMVFIFDNSNRLEAKADLAVSATEATKTGILTTSGVHTVFAAANIPAAIATELMSDDALTGTPVTVVDTETPANSVSGMTLDAFRKKILAISNAAGLNALTSAGSFFMVGDARLTFVPPTPEVPEPTENDVHMSIGRSVAKLHMTTDAGLTQPTTGVVTAIGYKAMNNPVDMYRFRNLDGGILKSPVYNEDGVDHTGDAIPGPDGRAKYFQHPAAYVPAGAAGAFYIPENANELSSSHNSTAVLIEGQFTPNANLIYSNTYTQPATLTGGKFFRVYNKQTGEWLAPFFNANITNQKTIVAAISGNLATDNVWISANKYEMDGNAGGNTGLLPEYYICEYPEGKAYWMLTLENTLKAGASRYEVERNDYFRVNLTSISACGAATDDEHDDDGVLPEDPIINIVPVNINATIEVAAWNGIGQNGQVR